jgi:hypothetical protein
MSPKKETSSMIGVERISEILRTIVASEHVTRDGRGLSVALIAPSDAGKSQVLLAHLPFNARILDDFTTASLQSVLNEKEPPRWIVVPDFNQAISHRGNVATLTMAFLLSLMGEGVTEIPGLDGETKLAAEQIRGRGLTISLMTAITPDMFFARAGKWRSTGLLRRLVPIYYAYTPATQHEIQLAIQNGKDSIDYPHRVLNFPMRPRYVKVPQPLAIRLREHSDKITRDQLQWERSGRTIRAVEYPFSTHKILKTYARARAWLRKHRTVTATDVDDTIEFSAFMRYDRPEQI